MNVARTLAPIRSLARAGMTTSAWQLFETAGLKTVGDRIDVLTLKGRLLKDLAGVEESHEKARLLSEAASAYAAAAQLEPATYPLINAATLALLSGDAGKAATLARDTLALLDSGNHAPETRYWIAATRAEALLLLGQDGEARTALDGAIAAAPQAWEDHAVTLRQFRLILACQGLPSDWLDVRQPPPALHFAGPIALAAHDACLDAQIDKMAAALAPGTATGALAAGFDIVAAERLLRAGAQLQIVLPAPIDDFVEASVRPAGADWLPRFERLMADAACVEILDPTDGLSNAVVMLAEEIALGGTISEARLRDADALMLRLDGATSHNDPAERPGLRRPVVARGAGMTDTMHALPGPDRPVALLGCRHADADRLAALTGAPAQMLPDGAISLCPDLARAAEAALQLSDPAGESNVVLDYAAPDAEGNADMAAVEALLTIEPHRFPIATRTAALALETRSRPARTALAGAGVGIAGDIDFFSLCEKRD